MSRNFPIDGNKLWNIILEKYKSIGAAGKAIGYSDSAFGNPCNRGEISEKLMIAAESILGIPYSEYAADEPTPRVPTNTRENKCMRSSEPCYYCNDDYKFLGDIIKEGQFRLGIAILPKEKMLEISLNIENYEGAELNLISERLFINYCPMCGRQL